MPLEAVGKNDSKAIELLKARLSGFETDEGRLKGLSYTPRPNDVIITTTPKAGTTWMQQICHQLRSGGDMSFDEISEVVPWIELAFDQGQDLEASQYGNEQGHLRLLKTHAWEPHCPRAPKTIVMMRHPYDVLVSFYHFFEDWFFERATISLESFAHEFWLSRGVPETRMQNASYFHHLISWYARRNDATVLFVFYEDLKENLNGEIARIARFLSTDRHDLTKSVPIAVDQSTFDFMKAHASKFNEKLSKLSRNEACGLPKTAGMNKSKIRQGHSGAQLSDELKERIDAKWNEIVKPITGCDDYDQLRKLCRRYISTD